MQDPQTTKEGDNMLRVKPSKIVLMILTFVFCLHLSGLTVADDCWDREGGGPTVTGDYTYPPGWFPEFQYNPNNPDEIDRNSSVEISVIGGTPPYTWQVSGNGFSIPSSTTDRTNTLSADDTACGAATITITDDCPTVATGYVRCTAGKWVEKASICELGGPADVCWHDAPYYYCQKVEGYIKEWIELSHLGGMPTCEEWGDAACAGRCDFYGYKHCGNSIADLSFFGGENICDCVSKPAGGYECWAIKHVRHWEWECE
jgi:hypothetical protein